MKDLTKLTADELMQLCETHKKIGSGFLLFYDAFTGDWQASLAALQGYEGIESYINASGDTKEEAMINLILKAK